MIDNAREQFMAGCLRIIFILLIYLCRGQLARQVQSLSLIQFENLLPRGVNGTAM